MSYVKTVWETGDVITAAKLNNLENGVESSAPMIVTFTGSDTVTANYSLSEILAALSADRPVMFRYQPDEQYQTYQYLTIQEICLEEDNTYIDFVSSPFVSVTGVIVNFIEMTAEEIIMQTSSYPEQ